MNFLHHLWPWVTDFIEDWSPEPTDPRELAECRSEREICDAGTPPDLPDSVLYPTVDLMEKAATVTYGKGGPVKRTRYRRVDLSRRRVVIALHQAGVERTESRWSQSAHRVTCHRAVGPTGARYRVHPLTVRLVATNRFDRSPWACIAIEILGNFEGLDGSGRWYQPERFGYGRATDAQLAGVWLEIVDIIQTLAALGIEVQGIVPHIVAGRSRSGRPNRQFCCGSRQWSEIGERAGSELGLAVPGPGFILGGAPIPEPWHGRFWPGCTRFL